MTYTGMTKEEYKATWGTPIGKDCISLDTSLCKYLGDRLAFLAEYTTSHPCGYSEKRWKRELADNAQALMAWANHFATDYAGNYAQEAEDCKNAQRAMRWVARNLGKLWD